MADRYAGRVAFFVVYIKEAHPETVVVLISIENSDEFAEDARASDVAALVRKQDFGPGLLRSIWKTHGPQV